MEAKSRINIGFHIIYAIFLVLFLLCIYYIIDIQYIKGDTWKAIGQTIKKFDATT